MKLSSAHEAILPVYLTKVGKPLFAAFNQTQEDWLRLPPYGTGGVIRYRPGLRKLPLFQLKVRVMRGYFRVDDRSMLLAKADALRPVFEDSLKRLAHYYGYMKLPRNYYFPESAEVFIYNEPWNNLTCIGWNILYVVMPRKWRKKVYRAHKLAGRKLPK